MQLGRLETVVLSAAGVVVIRGVLALFKDVIVPAPPQIVPDQPEKPPEMPRGAVPYMPDVEMDEWINQNGMPIVGGWTPTSQATGE